MTFKIYFIGKRGQGFCLVTADTKETASEFFYADSGNRKDKNTILTMEVT